MLPVATVVVTDLTTRGFSLLRGLETSTASIEVANQLGFVDEVEGLKSVQTLIPRLVDDSSPNTYSGNFGYAEFPLHTDLAHWARPPRYLLLRCIRGSARVTTRILDGQTLIDYFGSDALCCTLVQPRRPMRNGKQLIRLLGWSGKTLCDLRWDSIYLQPASRMSARVFTDILDFLHDARSLDVNLVEPGDTLLIDNWRCLHGRSTAGENDRGRHLERVYLTEVRRTWE